MRDPSSARASNARPITVAVTHDWLGPMTGAERVLEQILLCFPGADVYTTVDHLPDAHRHILHGSRVTTSFIQHLPRSRTAYWNYLPLMPLAFEQFNLEGYDLIISASHAVAKGVIVHPHQRHVCYLHSPMRFVWDLQPYYLDTFRMRRGLKGAAARVLFHWLRTWDVASAARVDRFVACSSYVARRCEQAYRREAVVCHPPCDVDFYTPGSVPREDFYLVASRLTPFKAIGPLVEAFRGIPGRRLVVVGDGPEGKRLRRDAPANVSFTGWQPDAVLRDFLRRARAFVFAAPEDFGIVMAEAHACGTPVIALGRGGAREIVRGIEDERPTGVFFPDQRPESIRSAVDLFEKNAGRFSTAACRENALRFTPAAFRDAFRREVELTSSTQHGG